MLSLRSVGLLLQVFVVAGCGKSPSAPVVASSSTAPASPSASVAPLPSATAAVVQGTVADLAAEYQP
jgi:hypothetical protein